uniref:Mannose-P-dolichol utilization defect 1 protein homolog n=1 Tax=Tetradesmus obliquus TaxID=3088 RepID=A0A383VSW1_TETOB|eukprot:jgi/Sobl393_1/14947/SZX68607.1
MAEVVKLLTHAYTDFLVHGHIPPTDVIKLIISKMLGYGILLFSTLVKLPQVANVLRAHSADGLSAVSCELETWGLLVHTAYGYLKGLAFSTYGEASILFAQNVLLLALIYKYNRMPLSRRLAAVILLGGAIAAVLTGHVSMALISHAYDLNNIILMSARLPQILQNFSARSTGQLSVITYAANTLGCVARLFTTMQEGGGSAMFRQYCISLVLNGILVTQILVFGNKGVAPKKAKPAAKRA